MAPVESLSGWRSRRVAIAFQPVPGGTAQKNSISIASTDFRYKPITLIGEGSEMITGSPFILMASFFRAIYEEGA
jgi:hypothetical protein